MLEIDNLYKNQREIIMKKPGGLILDSATSDGKDILIYTFLMKRIIFG